MTFQRNGRCPAIVVATIVLSAGIASAATLSGSVRSQGGDSVTDARMILVELNRDTFVDANGEYRFENVPGGFYHVQAISRRMGTHVQEITVGREDARLDFVLERSHHHETIVVTAGTGRHSSHVSRPVNVLEQDELRANLEPTLGETLRKQPGVSSTFFGQGSSRPIIRGQGAGRIRILEGGLDSGDASVTSPDHAVATDPLGAERVEIVRGPSTLLYGSTAVGGVVNVLDQRVPDHVPQKAFGGTLDMRAGNVSDERAGAIRFLGGSGAFAWTVSGFTRDADDYEIPGPAVENDPGSASGRLPNSALESDGFSVGGSWVTEHGHVGAALRTLDSLYGIPAGDEEIRIDLEQRRLDVRGRFDRSFGIFDSVAFSLGGTDYEHRELEDSEVGTVFVNDTFEGRVELRHGRNARIGGVIGVQYGSRDFEAIGEEAFVPPSATDNLAIFAVQELERGPMRYDFGLRYETQDLAVDETAALPDRDFDGLSASVGAVWVANPGYSVGATLSRSTRFPIAEELYSDGPHLATFSFERGDVNLGEERSLGLDLTLRKREGRIRGELNLFRNRYDDFIFEAPTGGIVDMLPVFQFDQSEAEFSGAELGLQIELLEIEDGHLGLEVVADTVRAELTDRNEDLPRIPPTRAGLRLHYIGEAWTATAGFDRYSDQDRVASFESETDGYTLVDARVAYRLLGSGLVHEIQLIGSNLTDELARPHTSRLKRLVPMPGRNVSLAYRLVF